MSSSDNNNNNKNSSVCPTSPIGLLQPPASRRTAHASLWSTQAASSVPVIQQQGAPIQAAPNALLASHFQMAEDDAYVDELAACENEEDAIFFNKLPHVALTRAPTPPLPSSNNYKKDDDGNAHPASTVGKSAFQLFESMNL